MLNVKGLVRVHLAKSRKSIGDSAEKIVCSRLTCPMCKIGKFRRFRENFEAVDIVCSFCKHAAQVKAHAVRDWETEEVTKLPGASWKTQKEHLEAGKYYPLYVMLHYRKEPCKILYLPVEFQIPQMFQPRKTRHLRSQKFDYYFDIHTKQYFFVVWDVMLTLEKNGRIKKNEVTDAGFSQLPGKKHFPYPRLPL